MTYEERNNHAYNEFVARLGMKMLERYEAQQAFLKEQADRYNAIMSQYNLQAAGQCPVRTSSSGHLSMKSNSSLFLPYALNTVSASSHSHTVYPNDFETSYLITADELEVIRAYKSGEDVLSTIMSQER